MNRRASIFIVALALIFLIGGGMYFWRVSSAATESNAVRAQIETFGSRLQAVPLLASEADVKKAMEDNYKDYVSSELLMKWESDSANAPGRLTSSPWPERIDIVNVSKSGGSYIAKGEIVEITSAGEAARRSVEMVLAKSGGKWLITDFQMGEYEASDDGSEKSFSGPTGISFRYTDPLPAEFISPQEWPPVVTVTEGAFSCVPRDNGPTGKRERKTISGRSFCVDTLNQGAAGSVYATYTYVSQVDGRLATARFTFRYPQCDNYDEPQRSMCKDERARFDVDAMAKRVFETLIIPAASVVPPAPKEVAMNGTMVCLPHKNTEGPQTLECAFGLKAADGKYYGLRDTDPMYKNVSAVPMNVPVTVNGRLILEGSQIYQSIGTIEVTSIVTRGK